MFYVLIVEDIESVLNHLKKLLLEALGDIRVDTASTVEEARRHLQAARDSPYDAVVLDIVLQPSIGPLEEPDFSLCEEIAALMPQTVVAHITSYAEIPQVHEHLWKVHLHEGTVRGFFLSKSEHEFGARLVQKLRAFLYGDFVQQEIATLFRSAPGRDAALRARETRRSRFAGMSGTHRLAILIRVIVASWSYLEPPAREAVKKYFAVDDTQEPARISLLSLDDNSPREGFS